MSSMSRSPAVPGDTTWTVPEASARDRLDKFLAAHGRLGSRGRVLTALDKGQIFVNGGEASRSDAGLRLDVGDTVRVWRDRPGSARRRWRPRAAGEVAVIHEDGLLLVVNKPAGLLTVPLERKAAAPSVYDHLEAHLRPHGKRRPLVVHRIDRDTSGLVVFAKTRAAQAALKKQFRRRQAERVYQALVYGRPEPREGTWRDHLVWDARVLIQRRTRPGDPRAAEAVCHYRVIESFGGVSLVEVRLETGKRNQIRLQARLRGHTLVGERRYVYGPDALRPVPFTRQALHAHRLAFNHPESGRRLSFEAPVPADLSELLERLRRRGS
ncbi:MAG TPA: RluA family pseudouridine synthase [Pseudomonadales bacterium]|nr:RluA family pseudouridine synthase [Pseudomonadales bacterium]